MRNVTLIAIDTAKNIFHLYAVNHEGKEVFKRKLARSKLVEFLATTPACTIAIEACAGSFHWARTFTKLGHTVKIISARYVKKFANTRNKNDFNDAKAIVKATRDPDMLEVAHKSVEQQEIQAMHILRDGYIRTRTSMINRVRALLTEFGMVVPRGRAKLMAVLPDLLNTQSAQLTYKTRLLVHELFELIKYINSMIDEQDKRIKHYAQNCERAKRLQQIPGVGPIISTALSYMIADPKIYKNGRKCASALGLTPREYTTGDKQRLGKISGEGNAYLRKNLVQGAQAILRRAHQRQNEPLMKWALDLKLRKGVNLTAVALANKMARIAWAMLVNGSEFSYKI